MGDCGRTSLNYYSRMAAPIVRSDYDALKQAAASFSNQAQAARQTIQALQSQLDTLQGGDWIGQGATAFYQEMGGSVMPTLKRLAAALDSASQTTLQIVQVVQQAEADAAAVFKVSGAGAAGAAAGAAAGIAAGGAAAGAAGAAAGAAGAASGAA